MVRHAHKHKTENIFKGTCVCMCDDRWVIISWQLRRSTAAILRARSRWHDYDRDVVVGDQWTAKCEYRLIQAIKKKCEQSVWWFINCSRVTYRPFTIICILRSVNIIIQFERDTYFKNIS